MWEPLLKSKFGVHYADVSMVWLASRLKDRSSSRKYPWTREELGYIDGSFQTLANTLEQKLINLGVKIHKNTAILDFRDGGKKHTLVWRSKEGQISNAQFAKIAVTMPTDQFLELFNPPASYRESLQKIKYLGALCIVLKLKHKLTNYYWTSINDPKAPFVALVEHTNFIDPSVYKGVILSTWASIWK